VSARLAVLLFWNLLAIASGAQADHVAATLTYRAASSCPSETRFRELVTVRLGYDPFGARSPDARVEVELVAQSGEIRGQLVLAQDAKLKERTLIGPRCESVAEALATTLALALDPLSAMRPPARSELLGIDAPLVPAQEAAPAVSPPLVPASELVSAPSPPGLDRLPPASQPLPPVPPRRESELAGAAYACATEGVVPGVALGGGIAGAFSRRHLFVLSDLRLVQTPGEVTSGGYHLRALALSAGLATCARFGSFVLCGMGRAGQLWSRAEEVRDPRTERRRVASLGVAAAFLIRVAPRWRLALGLEMSSPLTETRLRLAQDDAWQAPPVALAVAVGGMFGLR
jgi:hypothetical protein